MENKFNAIGIFNKITDEYCDLRAINTEKLDTYEYGQPQRKHMFGLALYGDFAVGSIFYAYATQREISVRDIVLFSEKQITEFQAERLKKHLECNQLYEFTFRVENRLGYTKIIIYDILC